MENQIIQLTEEDIRQMVTESVIKVLKESEMDEGLWDNLKSAWQGAKQGYNAQKALDRGTLGFKTEHDAQDTRYEIEHPLRKAENTAQEQANQLYAQAKEYRAMANKLMAKANAITKQYGLVKTGVGKRANAEQPQMGGVPAFTQGQGQRYQPSTPKRQIPQNLGQPLTV